MGESLSVSKSGSRVIRPGSRLNRRNALRLLGLPWSATKPEAHKVYKKMLVEARKRGDEDSQKSLSQIWSFLKRNLRSICRCGAFISKRWDGRSNARCRVCAIAFRMALLAFCISGCSPDKKTVTVQAPFNLHGTNQSVTKSFAVSQSAAAVPAPPKNVSVSVSANTGPIISNVRRTLESKPMNGGWAKEYSALTNFTFEMNTSGAGRLFRAHAHRSNVVTLVWEPQEAGVSNEFWIGRSPNNYTSILSAPYGQNYIRITNLPAGVNYIWGRAKNAVGISPPVNEPVAVNIITTNPPAPVLTIR